jgi:hypothetical protein
MSARPPFFEPDPAAGRPPHSPETDNSPLTQGLLNPEELRLLRAFFELLNEWDRKINIT